jgi:hypothetical protein
MAVPAAEAPSGEMLFVVRTHADARAIAAEAAAPCVHTWAVTEALVELLANAIEHGNLEFDFAAKARLLAQGEWEAEVARRQSLPPYLDRVAVLKRRREADTWWFEIHDMGSGFDWRPWLHAENTHRHAANGRGILVARELGKLDLEYLAPGNCVRFSARAA